MGFWNLKVEFWIYFFPPSNTGVETWGKWCYEVIFQFYESWKCMDSHWTFYEAYILHLPFSSSCRSIWWCGKGIPPCDIPCSSVLYSFVNVVLCELDSLANLVLYLIMKLYPFSFFTCVGGISVYLFFFYSMLYYIWILSNYDKCPKYMTLIRLQIKNMPLEILKLSNTGCKSSLTAQGQSAMEFIFWHDW